jgi:hypothetical protein
MRTRQNEPPDWVTTHPTATPQISDTSQHCNAGRAARCLVHAPVLMYHRRCESYLEHSSSHSSPKDTTMRRILVLLMSALAAVAAALTSAAVSAHADGYGSPLPHTQRVVVRPVHADGTPAAGYSVTRETRADGIQCWGASADAVDHGIDYCGASVTYTVACWKSRNHTVLCLRDPKRKHLVRIRYQGNYKTTPVESRPKPQALDLFSGNYCLVRDGGAWPQIHGHPQWQGQYSCDSNGIYGRGNDGINRSVNPWSVHVVNNPNNNTRNAIVVRRVQTAYYVGNAA